MSEPKLISPMLDDFIMGEPISDHHGVRCCPAMKKDSDEKYIVKIISIPASLTQLEALLLTGAYPDEGTALAYFKELADGIIDEAETLNRLAQLEGFLPYCDTQIVPMEGQTGYDVYLLSTYKKTLARHFSHDTMTHLGAINLGLDLCASLAVCRRSGYLYVDLKPSNVFITDEQEYRIGDIGFMRLDSLKYASLPDKYRSEYTAPEISDAYSSLNPTIDVYAVGLILYQAYNNGTLPFTETAAPAETFLAPMYADYEMAEIILKACAPNPEERWQDPIQMGQALISYMQRNGANDTPIVPPPVTDEKLIEIEETAFSDCSAENASTDVDAEVTEIEHIPADNPSKENDEILYHEDDFGNLSFLENMVADGIDPEQDDPAITYDEISDEVSEMLSQADELASHPVPDPVVAPDPVEIPMPEPLPTEENVPQAAADPDDSVELDDQELLLAVEEVDEPAEEDPAFTPIPKKRTGLWFRISLIVLLLLALLAGGFYYYTNYYLQSIESVKVDGSEDGLTVYVTSLIDDSKLSVVCSDAYGNQVVAPVSNGKAVFTNLVPDTGYSIYVRIEGFHRLIGQTSTAYSTPIQTSIVQFSAVAGSEDGSVILGFTVDGLDANQWTVTYSADGEAERTATFPSHMVTLTGLTVGKEYTFKLVPDTELYLTGTDQITFTASRLIYAQNLTVTSCMDHKLTVTWTAPNGTDVDSWTVRCYNNGGYNETIITSDTTAVFDNLDHTDSFTVEVIAGGMSVSQRAYVQANSITVTDFTAEMTAGNALALKWSTSHEIPSNGWILQYYIEGTDVNSTIPCAENSALLSSVIPGSTYLFTIKTSSGNPLLSETLSFTVPVSGT